MTAKLLYPCGVDLIGTAMHEQRGHASELERRIFPYLPDVQNRATIAPYVISTSFLIGAGCTLKIVARPSRNFRVETIHATGPCELLSVSCLGVEYAPREETSGARRWAYMRKVCPIHQDVICVISCVPGLFMLTGEPTNEATVNAPGGEFIEAPPPDPELDELEPQTTRGGLER